MHKTAECKESTVKCANCNGAHKSFSNDCPSKENYIQLRQRAQPTPQRSVNNNFANPNSSNYNRSFLNALRQNAPNNSNIWQATNNNSSNSKLRK